jgi:hypothetical protein
MQCKPYFEKQSQKLNFLLLKIDFTLLFTSKLAM